MDDPNVSIWFWSIAIIVFFVAKFLIGIFWILAAGCGLSNLIDRLKG